MIIPFRMYMHLVAKWKGPVYQTYDTVKDRFEFVDDHMSIFNGKDIIEIGCNAGLSIWQLSTHFKSYVGLEPNIEYYGQCHHTVVPLHPLPIVLINATLEQYLSVYPFTGNAFFCSNVLYWLSNVELDLLRSKVLSSCDTAMSIIRIKERSDQKNSYHLNREDNVVKYFKDAGFQTISVIRNPLIKVKGHYMGGHTAIICKR